MAFINDNSNRLKIAKDTSLKRGNEINSFFGCNLDENPFNFKAGQLQQNKNMEYLYSSGRSFIQTKRGSTLIKDIELPSLGAEVYTYNLSTEYFIWVDNAGYLRYEEITA